MTTALQKGKRSDVKMSKFTMEQYQINNRLELKESKVLSSSFQGSYDN
jgi:hypothetical protein